MPLPLAPDASRPVSRPSSAAGRDLLAAMLAAVASALIVPLLPWFAALDLFFYDAWHRLAGGRGEVAHTAIVAIDDASLARFNDTPLAFWQPQLGAAIATLREVGVAAIGIDLIQATSAETWLGSLGAGDTPAGRSYEAPYRAALASGGIVLATARATAGGEAHLLPPIEHQLLLPGGVDDLGVVNLEADADGFIRRLAPVLAADEPGVSFAARLVRAARPEASFNESATVAKPIPYAGPPGTVPRVSLALLTEPGAASRPEVKRLRDRVVVIAADASRLQDLQLTPYARALPGATPQLMSGGEVHAQVVEAWLSGRRLDVVPGGLLAALAALFGAGVAIVAARRSPTHATLVGGILVIVSLCASLIAFGRDVWLAPLSLLAGIAAAWGLGLVSRAGREARARSRLRALFARYVSDEVAELAVRDALPDTGGQAAEVTILFLDIRNFTALSEKLDSHEVFELLNAWLPRACDPILAGRGNVDKFIGDAVMAVFGAPLPLPDHARRAVDAARTIAAAADDFAGWVEARFPGRGLPPFAIGIGLHSGPAVVGNLGTVRRVEFTAIGDTVNVASRLESASKDLGWRIVASDATVQAAGPGLPTGGAEAVSLKGKSARLQVHEIPYED